MSFDGAAFGRRLAAARVWAGLEPKQVAAALGLSDEAIYQMERGERKRPPSTPLLRGLAEAVGQEPGWLLSGEAPPWSTPPAASPIPADVLRRARQAVERLAGEAAALAELLADDDEGGAEEPRTPARRARAS